ncbi:baseplate J/gp47 family protein [Erwiniaceae bacterium BAC15a-03b]|uniref:Baseplate J/gp47 family protein n=1 Tax=Winslowiella arboricola TaxID=2978220 RepID=A0A9J6PV76_9GAMM|nr:baseplate J/gp47 family protein [Winslowiella arboricola]MCU5775135.1 baseplate J/gp47 family protein [Winslowiella arboricola]MCU5780411.1 baseplate J/gp47 family protein [Winslowiella arboricola]
MAEVTVTTAVPSVTFSDIGVSVPDEVDILNGRLSDLDVATGGGMSKSLTTPQGQIAMSDTAIIADKNDSLALLANQVNPDYASGRMQDAIGQIYFIDRIPAIGTTVTATCTGLVGTIIPANSIAQDDSGFLYYSLASATIPATGSVNVVFQNQATGAIACPIGALNTIYRAITGWSGITNQTAGVLGNEVEGRANFEYRRKQSVAGNAKNQLGSIYANVLAVSGVTDAYVTQNNTAETVNKGFTNFPLPAHSLYVAVYGGTQEEIANAIFQKLPPGPPMVGNNSYTVYDEDHYVQPYPDYEIKWQTPTAINLHVKVELADNNFMPSDIVDQVKDSVIAAFNGEDGGTRARIGSVIYAGRYYAGVTSINPENVDIYGITLSKDGVTYLTSASFGIDEVPTLDRANIQVTLT